MTKMIIAHTQIEIFMIFILHLFLFFINYLLHHIFVVSFIKYRLDFPYNLVSFIFSLFCFLLFYSYLCVISLLYSWSQYVHIADGRMLKPGSNSALITSVRVRLQHHMTFFCFFGFLLQIIRCFSVWASCSRSRLRTWPVWVSWAWFPFHLNVVYKTAHAACVDLHRSQKLRKGKQESGFTHVNPHFWVFSMIQRGLLLRSLTTVSEVFGVVHSNIV